MFLHELCPFKFVLSGKNAYGCNSQVFTKLRPYIICNAAWGLKMHYSIHIQCEHFLLASKQIFAISETFSKMKYQAHQNRLGTRHAFHAKWFRTLYKNYAENPSVSRYSKPVVSWKACGRSALVSIEAAFAVGGCVCVNEWIIKLLMWRSLPFLFSPLCIGSQSERELPSIWVTPTYCRFGRDTVPCIWVVW